MRTLPRTRAVDPTTPATPTPSAPPAASSPPARPTLDPAAARAVFATWSGDPVVVVASPPGAGKTRLVTHLGRDLAERARLRIAIAAQTRAQALDVANRIAALGANVTLLGRKGSTAPPGLHPDVHFAPGRGAASIRDRIVVATTARWQWIPASAHRANVLIVDEAWQMTYADLGGLGDLADQLVMVGDPGQIAPVVAAETRRWDTWATGPHKPAPDAISAAYPEHITRLQLPHTWRLGPATTDLVQPVFYPHLPFGTMRPPSSLRIHGAELPEISTLPVTPAAGRDDPAIVRAAVDRVRALLAAGVLETTEGARPLLPSDVALIVPHVNQASAAAAHLADQPDIFAGTINQAQGIERHAVVAVHPLTGYRGATVAVADPGRLCVALSRHRSHLTLVTDTGLPELLDRAHAEDPTAPGVIAHRAVHRHLAAIGQE